MDGNPERLHPVPADQAPGDQVPAGTAALAQDLRLVLTRLKRRMRDQANIGDLTPSQMSALLRMERDGAATVSALARAESMRPQSMAPIVATLQAQGLVDGAPDPADGRQTLFSLTAGCRERIREGRAVRQDWLARLIRSGFSAAEQHTLRDAVELLRRLAEASDA